jgi:hypothetical protein
MSGTTCSYCGKVCAAEYGLEQHLEASKYCQTLHDIFINIDKGILPNGLTRKHGIEDGEEQNVGKIRLDDDRKPTALPDCAQVLARQGQDMDTNDDANGQDLFDPDAEDALEDDNDDVDWQNGEDQLEPLLVAQGSTVAGEAFREFCDHAQTNRVTFLQKEIMPSRLCTN